MKDKDLRDMNRADLEDEVMLLRAQARVLQNDMGQNVPALRVLKSLAGMLGTPCEPEAMALEIHRLQQNDALAPELAHWGRSAADRAN